LSAISVGWKSGVFQTDDLRDAELRVVLDAIVYSCLRAIFLGACWYECGNGRAQIDNEFRLDGCLRRFRWDFMVLGGVHTSGTMQVLLSQGVIPITMVLSMVMIGKRYHCLQMSGAAAIVAGLVLAKVLSGGDADLTANDPVFNMLFFVSLVPSALSSVYKEIAFRGFDGDLDVNVLQFWVAVFQVLVNFAAMPIYSLDVLGPQQVQVAEMPEITFGGSRCLFLLEDQVVADCGLPGERPCDHCANAWAAVIGYMLFNLSYNICTMMVIKHGSAALSFLVATMRMPLSSLAFSSTWIMGSEAADPTLSDYLSLVVIIFGLGCYRLGANLLNKNRRREQEALVAAGSSPGDSQWASPTASPPPSIQEGDPSKRVAPTVRARWQPLFSMIGVPSAAGPSFALVPKSGARGRSSERVRSDLYRRLGAASPLSSPRLRDHHSPARAATVTSPFAKSGAAMPTPPATRKASLYLPADEENGADAGGAGAMDFDLSGLPDTGHRQPSWLARKASKGAGVAGRR